MSQADFESDLLRGNTPTLVLAVLNEGPTHGYGIAKRINLLTDALAMKQGTLYPVLNALERDGLVTGAWEHPDGQRPRKMFAITDAGAAELQRRIAAWTRFSSGVDRILGVRQSAVGL